MKPGGSLKFRIYLRRGNGYTELHAIQRTATGLYMNPTRWEAGKGRFSSSWHEDGRRWTKIDRKVNGLVKLRDQPLSDFEGQFTLFVEMTTDVSVNGSLAREKVRLRSEDIVIDRGATFGLEVILSDRVIDLPKLPDRQNSDVYVKDSVFPVLIIEAFDPTSNAIPFPRFSRQEPLTEGQTLFFDEPGRI